LPFLVVHGRLQESEHFSDSAAAVFPFFIEIDSNPVGKNLGVRGEFPDG